MSAATETNNSRSIFFWVRMGGLLGLLIWQIGKMADSSVFGVTDFVEYWCAAKLNVTGGNPYSPEQMFPLQKSVGWEKDEPMMMQNPAWTLTILLPFAAFDFATGQVLWLIFQLGLVFACIELAWRYYGGSSERRWLYWLVGLTFFPALIVVRMGQIVPVMVLGLIGFLYFEKARKDWLAGITLVLVSVKPHLVYLIWPAMLVWIVMHRRWRILLGAIAGTVVAMAIPSIWNPHLLSQYLYTLTHRPPTSLMDYPTPTFGTLFCMVVGQENGWVRLIPTVAGLIWLGFHWSKQYRRWDWSSQFPLLILISVLTAFYTWPFDMVLFLLPVMQLTVMAESWSSRRRAWFALGVYSTINVIALIQAIAEHHSFWFFWMAPILTAGYFVMQREIRGRDAGRSPIMKESLAG